ncbi:hypothetical protein [Maridesulfovibrio sp.]|uniref:hypothetical protein n=1 Tax=Maridesulfovibrio sp. TaxID=2795000 RepID=UPI0029F54771|nr:hypothetical protein [Maridesulfovibrio sp.]
MESPYAGYFERVADAVRAKLTPEIKQAILEIKNAVPQDQKVKGIEVYQAVIRDGIRGYAGFMEWKKGKEEQMIVEWIP